jgi:hypothetical protein
LLHANLQEDQPDGSAESSQFPEEIQAEARGDPNIGGCWTVASQGQSGMEHCCRRCVANGEKLDEVPMFALFVERGLPLSTSDFFRGFMEFFKIEFVHLNPNIIFHISVYVHFYQALGIRSQWALFRIIFRLKPEPSREHIE